MSAHPRETTTTPGERRAPVTAPSLAAMKADRRPIVMVTAYDFPSAKTVDGAGVDVVLVGDSAANVVLGYDSTVPIGMDEMIMLTKAVRRGLDGPLLVGDMPFGSYEASNELAVLNAQRFVKEAGVGAVKLERGGASVDRARAIVRAGIPVMGHVGLTPQAVAALGGFKAQGKSAESAAQIAEEALALQAAGCFAIVFEAIPADVCAVLMAKMEIPVIGIGAGGATDGQVLVFHDLVGIGAGRAPKFVRRFSDTQAAMSSGVEAYAAAVRSRSFPGPEHSYAIDPMELDDFRRYLDQETLAGEDADASFTGWLG
ncbi:3-methyl-2-oxobutanoate hydroxymethyltransferase [Thermoleophilia bacterium SCSIO 60948]|nr:3-methyl-2-oxobutanoate hydroxymethyltransferase [Thermoleophilia bacterium SCSIO 60948]